jgi:hypothetical protein
MIVNWQINFFFSLLFYIQKINYVFILELVVVQCLKTNKQNHPSELNTLQVVVLIKINEEKNKYN